MKKLLIILLSVVAIASSCGRASKKEALRKEAEIERIRMQQDSARRADEERMAELQMKARQDSIAAAMAMANLQQHAARSSVGAFYVVIGSFLNRSNAASFKESQSNNFSDVAVVRSGRWNYVCVGGKFNSFAAANRTLPNVKANLGGGGSEEDEGEFSEDEEGGDESADTEEGGEEEEYSEEEESESPSGGSGSGQAWILRL
ncbi:MAG: SPOR domain-containing protein [Prevotellaceae bacterium]|jgi:hypothetical protein|nr:SPOR domain-containing protein [Prevotellaceae bacterium]